MINEPPISKRWVGYNNAPTIILKIIEILDEIKGTNVDISVIAFSYNIAYNRGSFLANRSFKVLINVLLVGSGSEESTF